MSLLYESHKTLGVPSPKVVPVKPTPGKCILVSGHDLIILRELLPICDREGINVYTHGEMLPAHSYPELRKHKSLAGQFGGAWYTQHREFGHFPGPILMTTNCLTEPHDSYKDRLFTAGAVGWEGCRHIGNTIETIKFDDVIAAAKSAPGFTEQQTRFDYPDPIHVTKRPESHTVGFGHETVLSVAPQILEAINKGDITRFFVIGGCDGFEGQRSYYSDLVANLPKTSVILTVGCGKMRLLPLAEQLGTIGETGIPRLLDMGQCNDSFSAVQVAISLAKVLNCQVSDLPLSIVLSWFEQKAVAVLLSCIHLGLKPIRIGPALPAFVTPAVLKVLVEKFGILPCGNPNTDAASMVRATGMVELGPEGKGEKKQ
jgi:hydroxylamine reductase